MNELGKHLQQLRESKGWSKTFVAEKLKLKNMATYANWEYGTRLPDAARIKQLANLYETTTDYLLGNSSNLLNVVSIDENNMVSFPVVGTIKAGPDGFAMSDYEGRMATISESVNLENDHIWLKVMVIQCLVMAFEMATWR